MNLILTNLKSGIVVFLVALPLCLGIALACNVPLFAGLLAGVIGGLIVTTFSGSVLSVSGPAAGLTSIVIASVASLGSYEMFVAAVFFAGVFQVLLGFLKAGSIGNYVPNAVIKGMLAGIGIILIIKQLPHLVGYDRDPEGDFDFSRADGQNTLTDLENMFSSFSMGPVIIGIIALGLLLAADLPFYKKNKALSVVPPALIAVIAGAVLTMVFHNIPSLAVANEHLVSLPVIRDFSDLKQAMTGPDFSGWKTVRFWEVALTLAIVASLETLLSLEAVDKLDPKRRASNSSKELFAQGIGNITAGLVGALPVTAVIVRSSANVNAGATHKLSALFHGVLLLFSVLLVPNLLMYIPNAALAGVLVYTGYKLTKLELFTQHYKKGLDQFLPFVVTIAVMLLTDLLKGVAAGIAVSVIFIIRANIRASFEIINDEINGRSVTMLKLPQHLTFLNKGYLLKCFQKVPDGSTIIIDGTINKTVNSDVKDVLSDFVDSAKEKKIDIQFIKYHI
jgi:MFS superfamily sulfate permease-like transporter